MTILKRPKKYAKTVGEIVQEREHLTFNPNDTIPNMLICMSTEGNSAGGITDKRGRFIGFITDREIVRKLYGNATKMQERLSTLTDIKASRHLKALDVMIGAPDTLHPDDDVEDAQDVITYFGYRYMPVVDGNRKLHGIIDARELYQHVYEKAQDTLESKDHLLSYFMGTELYGIGVKI